VVGASHRGLLRHLFGGGPVDRQLSHIQQRPVVVVPSLTQRSLSFRLRASRPAALPSAVTGLRRAAAGPHPQR
jgi:hypothetical protein